MSTPSPEAKQAVTGQIHIEHYFPKGYNPQAEPWCSIRQHHNTATAKLREELAIVERSRDSWKQIACAAQEQLAHQQPSAICPDCKQPLSGDDMVDREVHGRCQSQGEPSAPTPPTGGAEWEKRTSDFPKPDPSTPEVEKIAREAAVSFMNDGFGEQFTVGRAEILKHLTKRILAALAQSRAPLVAALRILLSSRKCWTGNEPEIPDEISAQFDITLPEARQICSALTGTGEK